MTPPPAEAGGGVTSASVFDFPADYDRQPPQDLAAEQSVLGGMLLSKDAIGDVVDDLAGAGDFYLPKHQAIYGAILDLYAKGEPADPITVAAELERRGELHRVDGAPYLHTCIALVPTAVNAGYYADIVAEKAVSRRFIEAGARIVQYGYGAGAAEKPDIGALATRAQQALESASRVREDGRGVSRFSDMIGDTLAAIEDFQAGAYSSGIRTGLVDFDEVTNGLHPGQLIVIAARPGVGKSVPGLQFAREAALRSGQPGAIFSLEMSCCAALKMPRSEALWVPMLVA